LQIRQSGGGAQIIVADHGEGIPSGDRDRVTKRFVRLEKSRTEPGNGLGLSLVKGIMRLHGGHLLLEDNKPGLKVILSFPQAAGGFRGKKGKASGQQITYQPGKPASGTS